VNGSLRCRREFRRTRARRVGQRRDGVDSDLLQHARCAGPLGQCVACRSWLAVMSWSRRP